MISKQFSELAIGSKFTLDNKQYTKTQPIKVSCCRSVNALETANSGNKIFVKPQQEVQVNG